MGCPCTEPSSAPLAPPLTKAPGVGDGDCGRLRRVVQAANLADGAHVDGDALVPQLQASPEFKEISAGPQA